MSIKHQTLRAADRLISSAFKESLPTYFHGEWIWLSRRCWSSVYGRYEPHMAQAIRANLRRGGVFWDVGANVGLFSLYAYKIAGADGEVVAFEPAPDVLALLRANIGSTPIKVLSIGIGNEDGRRLFAAQGSASSGSFHEAVTAINQHHLPEQPITDIQVMIRKLDTIMSDHKPPTLLKIDIEGFELEAIKGAERLLFQHCPILLIEVHPEQLALSGGSERELFDRLDGHGYSRTVIDRNANGLYTILAKCPAPRFQSD